MKDSIKPTIKYDSKLSMFVAILHPNIFSPCINV